MSCWRMAAAFPLIVRSAALLTAADSGSHAATPHCSLTASNLLPTLRVHLERWPLPSLRDTSTLLSITSCFSHHTGAAAIAMASALAMPMPSAQSGNLEDVSYEEEIYTPIPPAAANQTSRPPSAPATSQSEQQEPVRERESFTKTIVAPPALNPRRVSFTERDGEIDYRLTQMQQQQQQPASATSSFSVFNSTQPFDVQTVPTAPGPIPSAYDYSQSPMMMAASPPPLQRTQTMPDGVPALSLGSLSRSASQPSFQYQMQQSPGFSTFASPRLVRSLSPQPPSRLLRTLTATMPSSSPASLSSRAARIQTLLQEFDSKFLVTDVSGRQSYPAWAVPYAKEMLDKLEYVKTLERAEAETGDQKRTSISLSARERAAAPAFHQRYDSMLDQYYPQKHDAAFHASQLHTAKRAAAAATAVASSAATLSKAKGGSAKASVHSNCVGHAHGRHSDAGCEEPGQRIRVTKLHSAMTEQINLLSGSLKEAWQRIADREEEDREREDRRGEDSRAVREEMEEELRYFRDWRDWNKQKMQEMMLSMQRLMREQEDGQQRVNSIMAEQMELRARYDEAQRLMAEMEAKHDREIREMAGREREGRSQEERMRRERDEYQRQYALAQQRMQEMQQRMRQLEMERETTSQQLAAVSTPTSRPLQHLFAVSLPSSHRCCSAPCLSACLSSCGRVTTCLRRDCWSSVSHLHHAVAASQLRLQCSRSSRCCPAAFSVFFSVQALQQTSAQLQAKAAALEASHSALQSQHSALQSTHSTLQSTHSSLLSSHSALQSSHSELHSQHSASASLLSGLQSDIASTQRALADINALLRIEAEQSNRWREQSEQLQSQLSALQSRHSAQRVQALVPQLLTSVYRKRHADMQQQLAVKQAELKDIQRRCQELMGDSSRQSADQQHLLQQLQAKQAEVQAMQAELQAKQGEIQQLQYGNLQLQQSASQRIAELQSSNGEQARLLIETDAVNRELVGYVESTKSMVKELSFTRQMVAGYRGDYLHCNSDAAMLSLVYGNGDKSILFADMVLRWDHRSRPQDRYLLITDSRVYCLRSKRQSLFSSAYYHQLRRSVVLENLVSVSVSPSRGPAFVLHVNDQYDYLLESNKRQEVLYWLSRAYEARTGKQLRIVWGDEMVVRDRGQQYHREVSVPHSELLVIGKQSLLPIQQPLLQATQQLQPTPLIAPAQQPASVSTAGTARHAAS